MKYTLVVSRRVIVAPRIEDSAAVVAPNSSRALAVEFCIGGRIVPMTTNDTILA